MPKVSSILLAVVLAIAFASPGVEAAQVSKCIVNGTVSYQQGPCPSDKVRRQPTVEELNAAEKQKRRVAAAAAAASAAVPPAAPLAAEPGGASRTPVPPPAALSKFNCDGRKYCSQMKSCAEAQYFLAHCPGVNMDGDRNGIPCERQWCNR